MPRAPMGAEKRSEIVTLRITKAEREALEKMYGSAGKGLHALMRAWYVKGKK